MCQVRFVSLLLRDILTRERNTGRRYAIGRRTPHLQSARSQVQVESCLAGRSCRLVAGLWSELSHQPLATVSEPHPSPIVHNFSQISKFTHAARPTCGKCTGPPQLPRAERLLNTLRRHSNSFPERQSHTSDKMTKRTKKVGVTGKYGVRCVATTTHPTTLSALAVRIFTHG